MKIKNTYLIIFTGIVLRLFVATWNGFIEPTIGADLDALTFHKVAVAVASTKAMTPIFIGWVYAYVLGRIYAVTTPALFGGCLLSCLSWLASAIFLLKSMRLSNFRPKSRVRALLVYSFLPSSVLLTGVTLREPFQLMFVNMALFASLNIACNRSPWYWIVLLLSIAGMGVLHGALIVLGVFLFVGTAWLVLTQKNLVWLRWVCRGLALVGCLGGLALVDIMAYRLDDGVCAALQSFRSGAIEGRASYQSWINIGRLEEMPFFVFVALIQYMNEPILRLNFSLVDLPVLIENCLRLWLFWRMLHTVFTKPTSIESRPVVFVLIAYLIIESVWAIGTTNWGTAVRHHIPSLGLLLFGAYYFPYSATGTLRGKGIYGLT